MPFWFFPFTFQLILFRFLSTLDEVKLKEKGRTFHDMFLTKVQHYISPLAHLQIVL